MDNEYKTPEGQVYIPNQQPPVYPEYQQAADTSPVQPTYEGYGAQQYTQAPNQAQNPYAAYGQAPYNGSQPQWQAPYQGYTQEQTPYGQDQATYNGYTQGQAAYNGYGQNPYGTYPSQSPASQNGCAIAGMVMGIVGLSTCWFPFFNILALLLSIAGIPCSAIGNKSGSGKAVAGLVTSIIGTVLSFFFLIAYIGADVY